MPTIFNVDIPDASRYRVLGERSSVHEAENIKMVQTFIMHRNGREVPDQVVRDQKLMPDLLNPILVNYNNILVPINSVPNITHQYCNQLYFVNPNENRDGYYYLPNGEVYPFSIGGSMTGIEYKGRKLFIFSRHQVSERFENLEDICVGFNVRGIDRAGRSRRGIFYAEADSYFFYKDERSDQSDVFICDFTNILSKYISNTYITIRHKFFHISNENIVNDFDNANFCIAHGYPYEYLKDDGNHKVDINAWCNPIEEERANPIGSCEIIYKSDFDADGVSGGPVFAITNMQNGCGYGRLKFAGIIIKGDWKYNRKRLEYIKADALRDIVEYSVECPVSGKFKNDIVRKVRTKPYGYGVLYDEEVSLYGENRMPSVI